MPGFSRREWIRIGLGAMLLSEGDAFADARPSAATKRSNKMKTIGILGLGAHATVDFETRIHLAAQRMIEPRTPTGYPPMITWHHRRPPIVVNEDFTPVRPLRPDAALLDAARLLGAHADFLVLTANGPHVFTKEIEAAAGRPLVSMIAVTVAEVLRRGWRRVGVLGFFGPQVPAYADALRARNLEFALIDDERQARLNDAVFRLMEGRATDASRSAARDAIDALRRQQVDGIIPGCTEIPLLLGDAANAADLVNPAQLLAEEAVRQATA